MTARMMRCSMMANPFHLGDFRLLRPKAAYCSSGRLCHGKMVRGHHIKTSFATDEFLLCLELLRNKRNALSLGTAASPLPPCSSKASVPVTSLLAINLRRVASSVQRKPPTFELLPPQPDFPGGGGQIRPIATFFFNRVGDFLDEPLEPHFPCDHKGVPGDFRLFLSLYHVLIP